MTERVDRKLEELGLTLPEAAAPVASYVPLVEVPSDSGGLIHLSGQLPFRDGKVVTGRLGEGVSLEEGQDAARRCALMIVAQLKKHLGDLSRIERIVKLGVFVNSTPDFTDQPKVANGASDLMEALFGDAGKHARSAVGVPTLPLGAAVEIDVRPALGTPVRLGTMRGRVVRHFQEGVAIEFLSMLSAEDLEKYR